MLPSSLASDGVPVPRWRRAAGVVARGAGRSAALPLVAIGLGLVVASVGLFRKAPPAIAEVPDGYVALVNQKGVLMSDFISQTENETMKPFADTTPAERNKVLREMINEELLVQRALVLDLPETTIEVRDALVQGVEAQVSEPVWANMPTDEDLRAYYNKTQADYTNGGTMSIHNLVLRVGGFQNADQSTPQALSDAAEAVYRLRSGASLSYVLEHYGFAEATPYKGEELEFVAKMNLGEKLYAIATSLGDGEVSEPILDPDGVHVLVMERRRPPTIADFDTVRNQVYGAYRRSQRDQASTETVDVLRIQAQILIAPGVAE
jgi:parvulin-like peptidyl-prolyl isomerase